MAVVVVRRVPSGWRDRLRRYKVLIDDREVGRLRRGESGRYEVPPGQHVLAVAIERKLSRTLEVSGDSKDTVSFRCGPRRGLAVIESPQARRRHLALPGARHELTRS